MRNIYNKDILQISYWCVSLDDMRDIFNFFTQRIPEQKRNVCLKAKFSLGDSIETYNINEFLEQFDSKDKNLLDKLELQISLSKSTSDSFYFKDLFLRADFVDNWVEFEVRASDSDGSLKDWVAGTYDEMKRIKARLEMDQKYRSVFLKKVRNKDSLLKYYLIFDPIHKIKEEIIEEEKNQGTEKVKRDIMKLPSVIFRTKEESDSLILKNRRTVEWKDTIPGLIIIGVIISGISTYLFQKDNNSDIRIQGDNNVIGSNNNIKLNTEEIKQDEVVLNEYVFINNLCYITAITDKNGKIISYSVTTRSKDFNPELRPYQELSVTLARTKFSELPDAFEKNEVNVGAHNFHYQETYYFGNPGNYLTYIFSINDAGYVEINTNEYPTILDDLILNDPQKLKKFRENSYINTYTVTDVFFTSEQINKISSGPWLTGQVGIVDKNANVVNRNTLVNNLKKLAPGANIDYFKKILGEPVFINQL